MRISPSPAKDDHRTGGRKLRLNPICQHQDSTSYNYNSYHLASDREVRSARALVQFRASEGAMHAILSSRLPIVAESSFELCFDSAELDVVAVQESREQGDSHRQCFLHDRVCASADTMGCFGTQICIPRSICVVLDNIEARVKFRGVPSLSSQHKCLKSSISESVCAVPFMSADGDAHWAQFALPFLEFMIMKSRTRTVPCSHIPSKAATRLHLPLHHWNDMDIEPWHKASNRLRSCLLQVARSDVCQVILARNGVDHECASSF